METTKETIESINAERERELDSFASMLDALSILLDARARRLDFFCV